MLSEFREFVAKGSVTPWSRTVMPVVPLDDKQCLPVEECRPVEECPPDKRCLPSSVSKFDVADVMAAVPRVEL